MQFVTKNVFHLEKSMFQLYVFGCTKTRPSSSLLHLISSGSMWMTPVGRSVGLTVTIDYIIITIAAGFDVAAQKTASSFARQHLVPLQLCHHIISS